MGVKASSNSPLVLCWPLGLRRKPPLGIQSYLAPHIATLGPQFVNLRFSNICPLLSLLQLMLDPPAPGQLCVGLLLLCERQRV
jgi:hypothetical protein